MPTTFDLKTGLATTHLPPLRIRRAQIDRHEFGFKLTLSDCDGIKGSEAIEIVTDAEGLRTLISGVAAPVVLDAVRNMLAGEPVLPGVR